MYRGKKKLWLHYNVIVEVDTSVLLSLKSVTVRFTQSDRRQNNMEYKCGRTYGPQDRHSTFDVKEFRKDVRESRLKRVKDGKGLLQE